MGATGKSSHLGRKKYDVFKNIKFIWKLEEKFKKAEDLKKKLAAL